MITQLITGPGGRGVRGQGLGTLCLHWMEARANLNKSVFREVFIDIGLYIT